LYKKNSAVAEKPHDDIRDFFQGTGPERILVTGVPFSTRSHQQWHHSMFAAAGDPQYVCI